MRAATWTTPSAGWGVPNAASSGIDDVAERAQRFELARGELRGAAGGMRGGDRLRLLLLRLEERFQRADLACVGGRDILAVDRVARRVVEPAQRRGPAIAFAPD